MQPDAEWLPLPLPLPPREHRGDQPRDDSDEPNCDDHSDDSDDDLDHRPGVVVVNLV